MKRVNGLVTRVPMGICAAFSSLTCEEAHRPGRTISKWLSFYAVWVKWNWSGQRRDDEMTRQRLRVVLGGGHIMCADETATAVGLSGQV